MLTDGINTKDEVLKSSNRELKQKIKHQNIDGYEYK